MINRQDLVKRHDVVNRRIDPGGALTVGNGTIAMTVDVTGLQSLPDAYPVAPRPGATTGSLLATMSHWGWHATPNETGAEQSDSLRTYQTPRGPVEYVDMDSALGDDHLEQSNEKIAWLRGNPHRLDLGRLSFRWRSGANSQAAKFERHHIERIAQRLHLWQGLVDSSFSVAGATGDAQVFTSCDPEFDIFAVKMRWPALAREVELVLEFPYGSEDWGNGADWENPQAHRTQLTRDSEDPHLWRIRRTLDETTYDVIVKVSADDTELQLIGPHQVAIRPRTAELELAVAYSPNSAGMESFLRLHTASHIRQRSAAHWAKFWEEGGALDLSASTHEQSHELERRIVLSQYLTALHSAGELPPAETGLMANSWRGKFHLEMHYWHAAHFPLWNRTHLLTRSLEWYQKILPQAQQIAQFQGYRGARWPKQIGPDVQETPSPVAPFLIWQQPHPLVMAELTWRSNPTHDFLERYARIVEQTANFMADFAVKTESGYELCEPLIPAQESYAHVRSTLRNPTFELAYWRWGLELAIKWWHRLGRSAPDQWRQVANGLISPERQDDRYMAISTEPYLIRTDHPSMLCAYGVVPDVGMIDPHIMSNTLDDVYREWDWDSTWGWDYPVISMTAARLGRPEAAISALLGDRTKNSYLANGHNYQTPTLPLYLPGNGGLLLATAMLTAGWDGQDESAQPIFNQVKGWQAKFEGISRYL